MKNNRPRLDNPADYKVVKDMYFEKDLPLAEDLDPIERLERQEAKQKNIKNNSR